MPLWHHPPCPPKISLLFCCNAISSSKSLKSKAPSNNNLNPRSSCRFQPRCTRAETFQVPNRHQRLQTGQETIPSRMRFHLRIISSNNSRSETTPMSTSSNNKTSCFRSSSNRADGRHLRRRKRTPIFYEILAMDNSAPRQHRDIFLGRFVSVNFFWCSPVVYYTRRTRSKMNWYNKDGIASK